MKLSVFNSIKYSFKKKPRVSDRASVDVFWMPVSPLTRPKGAQKTIMFALGPFWAPKPKIGYPKGPRVARNDS